MKRLLVLIALVFVSVLSAQTKYDFDYLIEYEYQNTEDSQKETIYVLTNSNDNSYFLYMSDLKEDKFRLYFNVVDKFYSVSGIDKDLFLQAKTLMFTCKSAISRRENGDVKKFNFINNADTLIGNERYKNYSMKYNKSREGKKFKRGESVYIIEKGTAFHKPLLIFSSVFDMTITSDIFPNGIAREIYNISKYGKKAHYTLVDYKKVEKNISFPEGCEISKL